MSKIDPNDLSFLHAPRHERLCALWWEIEREVGIKSGSWMDLDSQTRESRARVIARVDWGHPCNEVSRDEMGAWPKKPRPTSLRVYSWYKGRRSWYITNPELESPHLLLVRWTRFTKSQVKAAVSKWAAKQWEAHNGGKKARRNSDPMTGLKQLAAYRLKRFKPKLTNYEVAIRIQRECDGEPHDDSWVRRAVREMGQQIADTKRFWESVPPHRRAF
jgi:hypothetical protein